MGSAIANSVGINLAIISRLILADGNCTFPPDWSGLVASLRYGDQGWGDGGGDA